jgi:hypothetical protein
MCLGIITCRHHAYVQIEAKGCIRRQLIPRRSLRLCSNPIIRFELQQLEADELLHCVLLGLSCLPARRLQMSPRERVPLLLIIRPHFSPGSPTTPCLPAKPRPRLVGHPSVMGQLSECGKQL